MVLAMASMRLVLLVLFLFLVTQDIRANRPSHETANRTQSSTTELVSEKCAACAADERGT
jgi:uncharacterized membrane protein